MPGGKKAANEFFNMMNQAAGYRDKQTIWGSTLLLKARELSRYLTGKNKEFDFVSPEFGVSRVDSQEIRQKILSISDSDWKK